MIKFFRSVLYISLAVLTILTFSCCKQEPDPVMPEGSDEPWGANPTREPEHTGVMSNRFFWGTWVRMDNGDEYIVWDTFVTQGGNRYEVRASDDNTLTMVAHGETHTFSKDSERIIICDKIPYFRKGGIDLKYTLSFIGFDSSEQTSRAAGNKGTVKGSGRSKTYGIERPGEVNMEERSITLTATTAIDPQIVTITYGEESYTTPELIVPYSGANMGTIALVGKDDYNLKITGTISDDQKDDGYLFGNNAKTYNMVLTITNISENECAASGCIIEAANENLTISSTDGTDLTGYPIPTLIKGATQTVNLNLCFGELTEPYIDTGIIIKIINKNGKKWDDYIPLRFFRGVYPIAIAAKNSRNNNNAALNGFVIYPDGNNQFFAIPHNNSKVVFVPTFKSEEPYLLVFSGATVTTQVDQNTEMFYTVEPGSMDAKSVITSGSGIFTILSYGGDNDSEINAPTEMNGFEAYISSKEIDYYKIQNAGNVWYGPERWQRDYKITFYTEHGNPPSSMMVQKDTELNSDQLPLLGASGWIFTGWYSDSSFTESSKVTSGYKVTTNLTLYAKWVELELEEGFVFVEGGTVVGSDDYNQYDTGAFPAGRTVTLSSFYMSDHELTQGEYKTYCCYTSSIPSSDHGAGADYPAYYVSWYDAIVYCNLKSMAEGLTPCYALSGEKDPKKWTGIKSSSGKYSCSYTSSNSTWNAITCDMTASGYRLPTEEEWEYAARGGQETYGTSAFANYFAGATTANYSATISNSDLDSVGWYQYNVCNNGVTGSDASWGNAGYGTHKIKTKAPNALGLYDMSGNVCEWCWDWFGSISTSETVTDPCGASSGSYRLGRGGSWGSYAYSCSVSARHYCSPNDRLVGYGFRLVRSVR